MKYLIAGLGNIGNEYDNTRHNIGFTVADVLAKELGATFKLDTQAYIADAKFRGRHLTIIKPTTYMNLSGRAVRYWLQKNNIPLENLLVIVDDLALPFGKQRLRPNGSDGGHNGLKNIAEILNSQDFARLRFGIGSEFRKGQQVNYVLGKWSEEEQKALPDLVQYAVETVKAFAILGLPMTMNQFNKK